jgi:uncharacterized protein (DUF58 family)
VRSDLFPPLRHIYRLSPTGRFFWVLTAAALLSVLGFWYAAIFYLSVGVLALLLVALVRDAIVLYFSLGTLSVDRRAAPVFSLGDRQEVTLHLANAGERTLGLEIIDELPVQLQVRNHRMHASLGGGERMDLSYVIQPLRRGRYQYGNINVFVQTTWGVLERHLIVPAEQEVAVYPSIIQMKRFSLRAAENIPTAGRRRPRPVSRSYAFDQISEYVRGDDLRSVNWRATARRGELMVNRYEAERAQRIYCLIDKGRTMRMPFAGLSLLDYAINATLSLSRVVLDRQDRAGLITFSDKLGDLLAADGKREQLRRILEILYRQEERPGESDYDLLYYATRRFLPGRSLLLLFTNFESNYALDRVLPALRRMTRHHRLLIILFENSEVEDMLHTPIGTVESVYVKNSARQFVQERQLIAARLRQNGILVLLTRPEALTGEVIRAYLDLKGRGGL